MHPRTRYVALALSGLAAVLLTACTATSASPSDAAPGGTDASRGAGQSPAEWTVLIYVAADNNLEEDALTNLKQMASVGSTDRVNVVTQVDRGGAVAEGALNLPAWGTTKRLYVQKGGFKELADLGQTDMTDARTLKDFITWGARTYPAKRYGLVLWDHGGAWRGYGSDVSAGKEESPMSLPDLAGALRDGGVTFDLLGFDACLMANVEVSLELQPYAKTLVASEEVEPGQGWDYGPFLSALAQDPTTSALDLGRAIADGYIGNLKRNAARKALYSTMSVIDLSQMPAVGSSLTDFVADLNRYVLADAQDGTTERLARLGQVLGQARYQTPAFGRETFNDPGFTFDLGLLAANATTATGDARIGESATSLNAALAKAVPYKAYGDGYKDSKLGGLTLFVPVQADVAVKTEESYRHLARISQTKWPETIRAFTSAAASDRKKPVVAAPKTDAFLITPGRGQAVITGRVTDDSLVTGVVVGVSMLTSDKQMIVSLEEQPRSYRNVNDISYTFSGMGWYLDNGKSPQLVFGVQWRPGQRAVFGRYQQTSQNKPRNAYFVFDETTGEMIEGFETVGGALGALLPGPGSLFQPFLLTPDVDYSTTSAFPVRDATLKKGPLPDGAYLISVTGFNIGDNVATGSVLVAVNGQADKR